MEHCNNINKMGKLIDLIKEEVSNFDYLNNDKRVKEKEDISIIYKDEFQKKFILDTIEGNVQAYVDNKDLNSMFRKYGDITDNFIDLDITINFKYENNNFDIEFTGNRVDILDGQLNSEEDINNIKWLQISAVLKANNGDTVNFQMYDKAPDKIKELFIKSCIKETLIKGLL